MTPGRLFAAAAKSPLAAEPRHSSKMANEPAALSSGGLAEHALKFAQAITSAKFSNDGMVTLASFLLAIMPPYLK